MTKFSKLKITFLFSILYFLFYSQASAASLNLISPVSGMGVGQEFRVDLMLDAGGQDINAIEGNIVFPDNLLGLKSINDGNSIVSFWIQKPAFGKNNSISFSGIIPGGFSGVLSPYYDGYRPGKVFSLIFLANKEGSGAIEIHDAKVLLNDGSGTPANTAISNLEFMISNPPAGEPISQSIAPQKDTNPPELFTPEISRDPDVFNNKWFLVFTAQDKGSGIDHYEVQETLNGEPDKNSWQVAVSPFVLKDQSRTSYIFVKAVDRSGNQRIVVVTPLYKPWYQKTLVDIIIGLFGLVVLLLAVRWLLKKHTKHRQY